MRRCIVAVATLLWLSACSANNNSIFRTYEVGDEKIGLIDAKQRAILSNKRKKTTRTDRRTTNVDTTEPESRKTEVVEESTTVEEPFTRFCVEPSPDVFTVLSSSLSVSGAFQSDAVSQSVAANLATQISEAGATISRTQTIQTLRELMYRTCERYLNGAINEDEFVTQASRDHRIIVSILAIEQLTNAVRPTPVAITASSKANTAKDVVAIRDQLAKARVTLEEKEELAASAKSAADAQEKVYEDLKAKRERQLAGEPVPSGESAVTEEQVNAAKTKSENAAETAKTAASTASDARVAVAALEELLRSPSQVQVSGETAVRLAAAQAVPQKVSDKVAAAINDIVARNLKFDETQAVCLSVIRGVNADQRNAVEKFCIAYLDRQKEEIEKEAAIIRRQKLEIEKSIEQEFGPLPN